MLVYILSVFRIKSHRRTEHFSIVSGYSDPKNRDGIEASYDFVARAQEEIGYACLIWLFTLFTFGIAITWNGVKKANLSLYFTVNGLFLLHFNLLYYMYEYPKIIILVDIVAVILLFASFICACVLGIIRLFSENPHHNHQHYHVHQVRQVPVPTVRGYVPRPRRRRHR